MDKVLARHRQIYWVEIVYAVSYWSIVYNVEENINEKVIGNYS